MIFLVLLAVSASIAANSVVQLALGIELVVAPGERGGRRLLVPASAMAFSGFLCWILFAYVLAPLSLGFFDQLIIFPLSSLVSVIFNKVFPGRSSHSDSEAAYTAFGGLAYGSAWLALRLSSSLVDAAVISLSCAAGFLVSDLLLGRIRSRSLIENVPRYLRGVPLALISAGLLSLISSFVAVAAFSALGVTK